ncbi:transcription termination factor 1-like [Stigmatopora argus]
MAEIRRLKEKYKRAREETPPADDAGERRLLLSGGERSEKEKEKGAPEEKGLPDDVEATREAPMGTQPREDECLKKKKKKKKKKGTEDERVPPLAELDADRRQEETGWPEEEDGNDHALVGVSVQKKKKRRLGEEEETELRSDQADWSELGTGDVGTPTEVTDLEQKIVQLEEFIPNIRTYDGHEIRKHLRYDLPRLLLFKQQGVAYRRGRFSHKENQQIHDNMARFLELTGLDSAEQLLFPQRFGEQQDYIRKLKGRHCFIMAIAEGIPRLCKHVISRALKIDYMNHGGCFSVEELAQLLHLHQIHGNRWSAIATKMDRSAFALQKRFAHISSGQGPWTSDEKKRLKGGVQAYLNGMAPRESSDPPDFLQDLRRVCSNLPWMEISRRVGTRNWSHCRNKWFGILQKALTPKESRKKGQILKSQIKLINILYASNVEEARDVDWEMVASKMRGQTPLNIQMHFRKLKITHVPNWWQRTYGEIIDFLQENVVPRLKEERILYRHPKEPDEDEPVRALDAALAHIFASDDNGFVEVDNTPSGRRRVAPESDAGLV